MDDPEVTHVILTTKMESIPIYKSCSHCGSRNRYADGSVRSTIIMMIIVLVGVSMIGYVEEMHMKKCNKRFDDMNMTDPCDVMEYLQSIASKPVWRVGLMAALMFACALTVIYIYTDQMNPWMFFMIMISVTYLCCVCMMSYLSWHIILPDGGQRCSKKLARELSRGSGEHKILHDDWDMNEGD